MNIQGAIKSGKPFKRENDREDEWLFIDGNNLIRFMKNPTQYFAQLTAVDILADDWEIKEQP